MQKKVQNMTEKEDTRLSLLTVNKMSVRTFQACKINFDVWICLFVQQKINLASSVIVSNLGCRILMELKNVSLIALKRGQEHRKCCSSSHVFRSQSLQIRSAGGVPVKCQCQWIDPKLCIYVLLGKSNSHTRFRSDLILVLATSGPKPKT
jgi:hypothetical protein